MSHIRTPDSNTEEPVNKLVDEGVSINNHTAINASGHRDQLDRQYRILSICGMALTIDNAWISIGAALNIAIYNGGPPGVLYEFLVACFYYCFIGASLAEMASSVPSSGGVYHWASIGPGLKHGRVLGFFAGSINLFSWLFGLASIVYILSELVLQMYSLYHNDYIIQSWHMFIIMVIITWSWIVATIFFNRFIPYLQQFGLFVVIVGGIATIIVLVVMPKTRSTSSFVWSDWNNNTGWGSGVAFLTGVLNGAFTIGTPDAITHVAEELPNPKRDLPIAIAVQIILGSIFAFLFAITLFYGITDLDAVLNSSGSFPLAEIYAQATGSIGATFGLLFIIFLSISPALIGVLLTVGRTWWSLARDNATPFASFFSQVNEPLSCPIQSTIFTGIMTTVFCAIAIGSKTAFSDLAASFVVLSTTSYALAIGGHLFSGRRNMPPGPFWMGKAGFVVNFIAFILIIFFNIIFCLPYTLPVTTASMNYSSVILVGVLILTTFWWVIHGIDKYPGPKLASSEEIEEGRRLSTI